MLGELRHARRSAGGVPARAVEFHVRLHAPQQPLRLLLHDPCSSAVAWVRAWLGDAKSSLGDAKSSLGDAKSSLGDAKSLAG